MGSIPSGAARGVSDSTIVTAGLCPPPATLSPGPSGGQITCQNGPVPSSPVIEADRSRVKPERTDHLSSTAASTTGLRGWLQTSCSQAEERYGTCLTAVAVLPSENLAVTVRVAPGVNSMLA